MDTVEVLTKARELITPPEAWTKGVYAKDGSGFDVIPSDEKAVCFCALGALYRVSGNSVGSPHDGLPGIDFLRKAMRIRVAKFNDERTHAEVLAAFDRAIAAARESPPCVTKKESSSAQPFPSLSDCKRCGNVSLG